MLLEAMLAAAGVTLCSLIGVFFFGHNRHLVGAERYVVPAAVGVFLSLVLFELVPEALAANERWAGLVVAAGFIAFYILSYELHRYFHRHEAAEEDCAHKGAATLILIGDAIHNAADGVVLGAAFLVDPALGAAVAFGLALHEVPQEIVEFGVLLRGGYTRARAALLNLLSASTIFIGTFLTIALAAAFEDYVWMITAFAAGNLLYIAASDLLPRVHGSLRNYRSFWSTLAALVLGFGLMTALLSYAHSAFGAEHHDAATRHGAAEDAAPDLEIGL